VKRRQGGGRSALGETRNSGPGQPLGPLGSRRRGASSSACTAEPAVIGTLSSGCPGPARSVVPSNRPATSSVVERCNAGPIPSCSRSTAGGPVSNGAASGWFSLPAGPGGATFRGTPVALSLRRTAFRHPPRGLHRLRSALPDPHPTIARRPAGAVQEGTGPGRPDFGSSNLR
jgi:hypothetical protein